MKQITLHAKSSQLCLYDMDKDPEFTKDQY